MQNTLSGFEGLANLVRCGNYILIWVVGYAPGTINTHNNTSVKNRLPGLWEQREDKSQLDLKDPRQDDNLARWLRSWEHATSATALTDSRMPAVMALDSNVHVLIGSSPACSVTRKQSYLQDPHSGRSQVSQLHILSCKMTKHTWNTQSEPFTHPHPSLLTNTIQQ